MIARASILMLVFFLAACDFPRDTEGTYTNLSGGVLRAGVVQEDPEGRKLLQEFAEKQGAGYQEEVAPPEVLLKALKEGRLEAVYGRIEHGSVLSEQAPATKPYQTLYPTLSTESPRPDQQTLESTGVAPGKEVEALWLEVHSSYRLDSNSPYRVELSKVKPAGSKLELPEQRYVYLVQPGEHRFLLELDRFLVSRTRPNQ